MPAGAGLGPSCRPEHVAQAPSASHATGINTIRAALAAEPDQRGSPGAGPTCIIIPKGKSITTRISIDVAGSYTVFVRALRAGKLTPVDVLIDDQLVPPVNAKAGQTLLAGLVTLTKGKHTLTLRPQAGQDARADFVLLTNDPTIGGYDFSSHAVPVE